MTRKQELQRLEYVANNPEKFPDHYNTALEKLEQIKLGKELQKKHFDNLKAIDKRFKELVKEESCNSVRADRMHKQAAAKRLATEKIMQASLSLNEIVEAARQDLVEKTGFDPNNIKEHIETTPYTPDAQELAEMQALEKLQEECKQSHKPENLDPEDGCIHCGYNAK